ncbi:hypothetical protein A2841_04130 [Candidatus Kaiserbacteria bacterium RIFCSPHIGHO2_01_FULL_48_10]|uniref:Uncharacterized protein n=1 Tax=Candidatus Kaiserbacteria bacterium RIFCSPHIGHO2_01_FULL_48_10 TaxID=1798476 RepID=A0A1F6C5E7_9BACT|nr:MAG: hypothetical protein A2841_04130 [Candidatus Kaiserbacteria bacterium RIFCSPHIGHO2_01_FULL_48_10]
MDETQQLIRERLAQIPKEVRDAINAVDLRPRLQKITEKYQLHIDQAGVLENETLFVMLGLEAPNDFPGNITRELKIPAAQAQLITTSVNEEIFMPIREALRKMFEQDAEEGVKKEHEMLTATPGGITPKTTPVAETLLQTPGIPEKSSDLDAERKQLLQEIETIAVLKEPEVRSTNNELRGGQKSMTPPSNLPTGTIAETKLQEMFRLPKEEKKVEAPQVAKPVPKPPQSYSVDPYREPLG